MEAPELAPAAAAAAAVAVAVAEAPATSTVPSDDFPSDEISRAILSSVESLCSFDALPISPALDIKAYA